MTSARLILIVDDQKSIRCLLRAMLAKLGIEAIEAGDGREALELYERERPDMVLTDLDMPEMDGLSLIAALNDRWDDVPVIVISGLGTLTDAIEAVHRGAWDYLTKPINDSQLRIALTRALERRRLLEENRLYRERLEEQVQLKTREICESRERYQRLLESVTSYVYTVHFYGGSNLKTEHRPGCYEVTGYRPHEYGDDPHLWYRVVHEEDRTLVVEMAKRILSEPESLGFEHRIRHKDGSVRWVRNTLVPSRNCEGLLISYDGIITDITERRGIQDRLQRHMDHLAALRTIDHAISGSLDLHTTLTVLLHETVKRLGVDAACVLLLNSFSQELEYASGLGFESEQTRFARVVMGEGFAGRVARERKTQVLSDIGESAVKVPMRLERERFRAYVGVPLVAKGQVKGVLELCHRSPLQPDREWLDFVEALAGQAAIALDNADLYANLQRSHTDLLLAYDTTIEGWSRALDYRDQETEGHSRRVMAMTVHIARAVGVRHDALVHVRRGALLHDIGKLGVPDSILLKPGKLTDEEFSVMKRHPEIAYEMLSPIEFLRQALDIPYLHHERWDGGGYPRGLKEEQIPLAVRIFSIVDVWDALSSDRPYRSGWPQDEVLGYLKSQAGAHFDPAVVDLFEKAIAAPGMPVGGGLFLVLFQGEGVVTFLAQGKPDELVTVGLQAARHVLHRLAVVQEDRGLLAVFEVLQGELGLDEVGRAGYAPQVYGLHLPLL